MEKPLESDKHPSLWPLVLLGILVSWLSHESKAVHPQGNPENKRDAGHVDSPPVAEIVPTPPTKSKTTCRPDQTPWWKTMLEIVALFVALGLLYFNYRQTKATEQAANTATTAANTAQKQLEMSERPWVSAEFFIDYPIEFQPNGDMGVRLRVVMKNIGHSVATDVRLVLGADPEGGGGWFLNTPKEQKEMCDNWRNVNFAGQSNGGFTTLFPGEVYVEQESFKITKEQIEKVQAEVGGKREISGISLFGCVNYGFAFALGHHQTGFNYDLIKPGPPPAQPPKFGEAIGGAMYMNLGENIPASQLKIRRSIFGGFYID
jgi:hypothetical protein